MTHARQRTLYGRTTPAMESRFLNEVPEENREWLSKPDPRPVTHWDDTWGDEHISYTASASPRTAIPRKSTPAAGGVRKSGGSSAPLLQLQPGESVRHDAFGRGMVLSIRPMGGDALIEVAFDQVGTKKLMLKAAGAHLTKE